MGFTINIDYNLIRKNGVKLAKKELNNFANKVEKGVKSRTPEDTKELIKSIGKSKQTINGMQIQQKVYDKKGLNYTKFVEYGVSGKTYNYHKPKGTVFLVGVGAGMFRKTHFDLKDKFNGNE